MMYLCNRVARIISYLCSLNSISMDKKLNRIKVVLVEHDVSQKDLAAKLGKSFSTVNAYCCNRQQPNLDVLNRIAKILGVDMQELIDGYKK